MLRPFFLAILNDRVSTGSTVNSPPHSDIETNEIDDGSSFTPAVEYWVLLIKSVRFQFDSVTFRPVIISISDGEVEELKTKRTQDTEHRRR